MNLRVSILGLALTAGLLGIATSSYGQRGGMGLPGGTNQAEESAYQAFYSESIIDQKIKLGEDFIQQYSNSSYATQVESQLVYLYYNRANWPKFYAIADKLLAKDQNNLPVLRLVGWVIPRMYDPRDPSEPAKLDKSEKYEKRVLAIIATMKKPKTLTDDQFDQEKTSDEWQAHSALGMTYFRRKDYENSAKEFQLATSEESPEPDPSDLYTLAVDLQNLNRTDEAVDAFTKCAQIAADLQDRCKMAANRPAEEAALVTFDNEPSADTRILLGEEFDRKYPASPYWETVESVLVALYDDKRDWPKFYPAADRIIAKDPDNVPVLMLVGREIPRVYDDDTPDAKAKLAESEKYEKHALDLIANMQPALGTTAEQFSQAKQDAAAQAHSGLGLTYFRRQDFADSAKELQLATTESPDPDPLDFYILGIDLHKLNRPTEAADAFTKCSRMPSEMRAQCKRDADGAMRPPLPPTPSAAPARQPASQPRMPGSGARKLDVKTDLEVSHLTFQKADGLNQEDVTVVAALFDSDGNYVDGAQKNAQMNLDDSTLAQIIATGFYVEMNFDVKPGDYMLRVVARDSNDGHISTQSATITVPN